MQKVLKDMADIDHYLQQADAEFDALRHATRAAAIADDQSMKVRFQ
jgi:hypothetical protein